MPLAANPADSELTACGLPRDWADRQSWTLLDTDFQDGRRFLAIWLAWQQDPRRPHMLHYVGMAPTAPRFAGAHGVAQASGLPIGAQDLQAQCAGLAAGFHRVILDQARVSLTLCLGSVQAVLAEHVFQADTVFAANLPAKWALQLLARRCKRGTRLCLPTAAQEGSAGTPITDPSAALQAVGFSLDTAAAQPAFRTATFNPRWTLATSRNPSRHVAQAPARCAIVGAGLAGASVAHALAVRGWQVSVFDQEPLPAGGASGLPAGLAVPHVSLDNNPRSRLSRAGTSLLMQHAQALLVCAQDWAPSGVMEHRSDGTTRWHAQACWIKPTRLVQAWLAQPGIRFVGNTQVAALQRAGDLWQPHDPQGRSLGDFELVVVANAMGCTALIKSLPAQVHAAPDLLDKLAALHGVHGTLSHGTYAEILADLPDTPVNGNGCFIPQVPGPNGAQWFAGSTFESDARAAADVWAQHAANMERLGHLLPPSEVDLAQTLSRGPVQLWSATRCVTHDRLPLVGPLDTASGSGLWLCVGMGSRGLSFSALCAQLLVARLGGEPLPVEFSLSRALDVNRARRQRSAKNQSPLRPFAAIQSPEAD